MKIEIENLKAQMQGRKLNIYQKADALIEFNKLLDYVEELEQLTIPAVVGRSEQSVCDCVIGYEGEMPIIFEMCKKCKSKI